ncbi:MAG: hypothetical protein ACRD22_17005, partial [Terriglobia bacterium]
LCAMEQPFRRTSCSRASSRFLAAQSVIEQGVIGELHDLEVRVTVYTPWHLRTFMPGIPRVEILYHALAPRIPW